MKSHAKDRAQELRKRAYRERRKIDPLVDLNTRSPSEIAVLLRAAANNLGRSESDISTYEVMMNEDWLTGIGQLKDMSVAVSPYGLAREVQKLAKLDDSFSSVPEGTRPN